MTMAATNLDGMAKGYARKDTLVDGDHHHTTSTSLRPGEQHYLRGPPRPAAASAGSSRTAVLSADAPPIQIMATFQPGSWAFGYCSLKSDREVRVNTE
jgi:hypothetical protein